MTIRGLMCVTGTGTGVGKTVAAAALAACAPGAATLVKATQTGVATDEPGDAAEVARLVPGTATVELRRFPEPLAPGTAARRAGLPEPRVADLAAEIRGVPGDLVLVEGAGGLLVRFRDDPVETFADLAVALAAPAVVVTAAGLGTLNTTELTLEALDRRGIPLAGVIVGAWPQDPDLACWTNLTDLATIAGEPLSGVLPDGMAGLDPERFAAAAAAGLSPRFGGTFDAADFENKHRHPEGDPQ